MPAVHSLPFSAESSVAGYALRHRAQQYSGQKKNSFCPSLPLPRFQHLKAFFSFPPYSCLSLRLRSVIHRKSQRFPMFLQHIAVIPFSDALHRFIPLPSIRFRHRAQQYVIAPFRRNTIQLPFPSLSLRSVSIIYLQVWCLVYELLPVKDSPRSQVHVLVPKHVDMQHQY